MFMTITTVVCIPLGVLECNMGSPDVNKNGEVSREMRTIHEHSKVLDAHL